jgi:hypothetical protein
MQDHRIRSDQLFALQAVDHEVRRFGEIELGQLRADRVEKNLDVLLETSLRQRVNESPAKQPGFFSAYLVRLGAPVLEGSIAPLPA